MEPTLACEGAESLAEVGETVAALKRAAWRHPELHTVAGAVIAILAPLDPAARLRVLRASAILLEVDVAPLGLYP